MTFDRPSNLRQFHHNFTGFVVVNIIPSSIVFFFLSILLLPFFFFFLLTDIKDFFNFPFIFRLFEIGEIQDSIGNKWRRRHVHSLGKYHPIPRE